MTTPKPDPAGSAASPLPSADERDFAAYNAAQRSRPVRPLAERAAAAGRTGERPHGGGVGCGSGVEAAHLARHGWRVHATDADPSVEVDLRALAAELPIEYRTARLEDTPITPCHLLLSCMTLPFVPARHFTRVWRRIREALQPGGVLAVDLFGVRDDWADSDGSFFTREQVNDLLQGLVVLSLEERERDGRSFSGPKHWHTFQLVARQPLG